MNRMKPKTWISTVALLALGLMGAPSANAQAEQGSDQVATPPAAGPVRLARVSFVEGNVTWRPDDSSAWSPATINMPLQQGSEIWVNGGGRAEVQFDDGSDIRLGNNAVATLQSLYSDTQGEFTELKLNDGTSSLHLKDKYSIYQVDTPFESVKAAGPARLRVDVGSEVAVGVRTGSATISTSAGDTALRSGDFAVVRDAQDSPRIEGLPRADAWDRFDDDRDAELIGGTEHVPANIAMVAGGIGHYGHWRHEAAYGWVWAPEVSVGWRPYHDGRWMWEASFGWTWVGNEAWGWAPYHYGTWAHFSYGWGWCPGPYHQYWSPAVVSFTSYNGDYCWTPLCPEEVVYPAAFGIGFGSGNWWFNFSIGGCAIYSPWERGLCRPVLFGRDDFGRRGFDAFGERRFAANDFGFVPRNARFGASAVSEEHFGQTGRFREIHGNAFQAFERGDHVMAAGHAFSGPISARPTMSSITPTHTFSSSERPTALDRSLYRAPVGSNRAGEPFGRTVNGGSGRGNNGNSRSNRGGAYSGGGSSVERARQSLGYTGRTGSSSAGSRTGDRASRDATPNNRGIERNSAGSGSVERARQSLSSSGRSRDNGDRTNASRDRGTTTQSTGSGRSTGSDRTSDYRGSSSRDRGDTQRGSSRGTQGVSHDSSSSRSRDSSSSDHSSRGGSSGSGDRGNSRGSDRNNNGGDNGRSGH